MVRGVYGWMGVALLAAAVGVGCGAGNTLLQARDGFAQARDAGAETKAVYEYSAAETYLQLAEHEFSDNDFKQTEAYAQKSLNFSQQALKVAGGGAR